MEHKITPEEPFLLQELFTSVLYRLSLYTSALNVLVKLDKLNLFWLDLHKSIAWT